MLHYPTFYFDDSGGQDTGVVLFSGFVSTEKKWGRFEREWKHAMSEYPELGGYLHMKEFMHDPKISESRRDQIEYHLVHIAKQNTLFPVSIVVDTEDYGEFQSVVKNIDYYGRSAYSFCFQTALGVLTEELSKRGYVEDIALVFDEGPQMKLISELYEYIRRQDFPYSKRLASLTFMDDEKAPPLQAADLIAWETHRYSVNRRAGAPNLGKALASLIDSVPRELSKYWDKRSFTMMMEVFRVVSLEGVPLELTQTPEGRLQADEIFSRNMGKINLLEPPPERREACREGVLVGETLYRKRGKKSPDNAPPQPPSGAGSIQ